MVLKAAAKTGRIECDNSVIQMRRKQSSSRIGPSNTYFAVSDAASNARSVGVGVSKRNRCTSSVRTKLSCTKKLTQVMPMCAARQSARARVESEPVPGELHSVVFEDVRQSRPAKPRARTPGEIQTDARSRNQRSRSVSSASPLAIRTANAVSARTHPRTWRDGDERQRRISRTSGVEVMRVPELNQGRAMCCVR